MTESIDNGAGWHHLPDLASRRVGGSVVAASDEFFAERENLIKPESPVHHPHTFTNKGQEYDGWETRRRRDETDEADWAIIRLGIPGQVRAIVVDTSFFVGNYPPFGSVEACGFDGYPGMAELTRADWQTVVARAPLRGDTHNVFTVRDSRRYTHVRLRIYPDGGVARCRVHGVAILDPRWLTDVPLDLAALSNGGAVVRCSDSFFSPPNNMLLPGLARDMGDGWETARRRDNGHDWAVVRLAGRSTPRVVEIDTTHYRGNAPDRVSISGTDSTGSELEAAADWFPVLPETVLRPDTSHRFRVAVDRPVTHLRLVSIPDGGIGRFRVYGQLAEDGTQALRAQWFTTLPDTQAIDILTREAGLDRTRAEELVKARMAGTRIPSELIPCLFG